jgi:hypothetical protein
VAQNSVVEGGGHIDARKKRFWDVVPACALHRKNFQNGIPAHSVTKIPICLSVCGTAEDVNSK